MHVRGLLRPLRFLPLRKQALNGDMTKYICCQGYAPCIPGRCGEQKCPSFCLCVESCCCFTTSMYATRLTIQHDHGIMNSKCDECIICTTGVCGWLSCLCTICAALSGNEGCRDAADCLACFVQCLYLTVCSCMSAQHRIQMNELGLTGDGSGTYQSPRYRAPQQMIMADKM